MKPRWKTAIELAVEIGCLFVGSNIVTQSWTWPPQLPEWIFVVLGFLVIFMFIDKIKDSWRDL